MTEVSQGRIALEETGGRQAPDHLILSPGSQWGFWRWSCLRGAGFPASLPLSTSSPECAEAADRLAQADDEAERLRLAALAAFKREIASSDAAQQSLLQKTLRRLKKGRLPDSIDCGQSAAAALEAYREARSQADRHVDEYERSFKAAVLEISQVIRKVAGDSAFREAVTWQNRHALHTGIDALLRGDIAARGTKQRQHEQMVANYMQRYCLKNDTIGFFGPVGWARLVPDGKPLAIRVGSSLVASRSLFFEGWCINELGKVLSSSKGVLAWCAPRRVPPMYLEGAMLYMPFIPPSKLPEKHVAVLTACDGKRPARQLVRDLCRAFPHLLRDEDDAYKTLHILKAMGLISWAIETPVSLRPEEALRQAVERIQDESLRRPALRSIEELEAARRAIAASAGKPQELDEALGRLDSTFTRLTNLASTREAGKTYAGRTLVFEDCRRDIEVEIGQDILRALEPPLSLMLTSARWFTVELARTYREALRSVYNELVQKTGTRAVPAGILVPFAHKMFLSEDTQLTDNVVAAFQKQWEEVLQLREGQTRVNFTSVELRSHVEEAFKAAKPGWMFARYHSPDIMIAATSAEAIERGDYQLVLGEFHMGTNTLAPAFFLEQHPAREELMRAIKLDMVRPRLEPLLSYSMPSVNARTIIGLTSPNDYYLALTPDAFGVKESQYVPIGSLIFEEIDGELVFRSRDGRLRFEIIEALGGLMSSRTASSFKLLAARPHTPRIIIDRLVVARESWRFAAEELSFAFEKDEPGRFIAARRWARAAQLPRFVFAKTPVEIKPFYTDFLSPIYVEILAKMVRRTAESSGHVTLSEMLPRADQLWLPDNEGHRYTSELRIVAVDMAI